MHHTKYKGDLGEAKANARLIELGFMTLSPNTEHAPFDIVAYKDKRFIRVQVKYITPRNDSICVDLRGSYNYSKGHVKTSAKRTEIDLVAVYCPENDKCYFIPISMVKGNTISFKVSRADLFDFDPDHCTLDIPPDDQEL